MGFLDKLKAKALAKVKANTAKKTAKILKKGKKHPTKTAKETVDAAFKKGNTVGKTGSVNRRKKKP